MERRKKYRSILLLLLPGMLLVSYLIIKSARYLAGESPIIQKADFHLAAKELSDVFNCNELQSDQRYLYKTLSVHGVINMVRKNESGNYMVSLGGNNVPGQSYSVCCTLDSLYNLHSPSLKTGDSATIRGICAGVLNDVVLLQCIIEKQ